MPRKETRRWEADEEKEPPKNHSRVVYYYHADVGNFHFGRNHPMKPHRLSALNDLVSTYGLHRYMKVVEPPRLTSEEMTKFHSRQYIDFLEHTTPSTISSRIHDMQRFGICDDCPLFENLHEYCSLYAGGSVEGAKRLNHQLADIVINWPGGLHHAKRTEASGFCFVNDIVLAILELLKYHKRVLYIDIDVHHGDGVEEAFNTTDRVMTLSFHRYGAFFPGTGGLLDVGFRKGKYFSLNVPFQQGLRDQDFESMYKPIIDGVMARFRPEAVVLQCGADSLTGDRLGQFELTIDGHSSCVSYVKKFGLPMLVVGGGGYTLRNVARCWTKETALLLDVPISDVIPQDCRYRPFFGPDFTLTAPLRNAYENKNNPEFLDKIRTECLNHLQMLHGAPSVQMGPLPGSAEAEIIQMERFEDRVALAMGHNVDDTDDVQFGGKRLR